jgi:uroporphyrinogen decarboxylase
MLTKRERLEKTIAGEATDRVPVALWRHWPGDDQRPADLVQACVDFQKQWDFDFIKITPAANYSVVDYGVQDRWTGNVEGIRETTKRVVERSVDWTTLRALDPKKGSLGQQLEAVRLMQDALKGNVPYLPTIFSPLAQAKYLAGNELVIEHLRTAPERLKTGLNMITENTLRFIEALQLSGAAGIGGIFYAIQHASFAQMTVKEYEEFGRPYDLQILNALPKTWWLNIAHLHGPLPMLDAVANYPVQVINWHDRETEPNLALGKLKFAGAVCGGLGQMDMHIGNPGGVREQAREAFDMTNRRRFILSTGCVIMTTTPQSNIRAARESVEITKAVV